jgi:hypothetical protein
VKCAQFYQENSSFALAILKHTGGLSYYNHGDKSWTSLRVEIFCCNTAYYKETYYALGTDGSLVVCEVNGECSSIKVTPPIEFDLQEWDRKYLVNARKDLLLVIQYCGIMLKFRIFKINWN